MLSIFKYLPPLHKLTSLLKLNAPLKDPIKHRSRNSLNHRNGGESRLTTWLKHRRVSHSVRPVSRLSWSFNSPEFRRCLLRSMFYQYYTRPDPNFAMGVPAPCNTRWIRVSEFAGNLCRSLLSTYPAKRRPRKETLIVCNSKIGLFNFNL